MADMYDFENSMKRMERGGPWQEKIGGRYVGAQRDNTQANAYLYSRLLADLNDERVGGRVGVYNPISPEYYANIALPESKTVPNTQKTINTPLGQLNYGQGDEANVFSATFTPTNYYLQALARKLMNTNEGNI